MGGVRRNLHTPARRDINTSCTHQHPEMSPTQANLCACVCEKVLFKVDLTVEQTVSLCNVLPSYFDISTGPAEFLSHHICLGLAEVDASLNK